MAWVVQTACLVVAAARQQVGPRERRACHLPSIAGKYGLVSGSAAARFAAAVCMSWWWVCARGNGVCV